MRRTLAASLVAMAVAAACTGDPGNRAPGERAPDAKLSQGAANAYVAPGWKPGDEASWEQHLRTRTQAQNEYQRVTR